MNKLKKNNAGISLVELLVSITILAIIVLPLLSAFVVSTRTNYKAKKKLRTTNIAENFMEGIEKTKLKDLAYQFNYPDEGFDISNLGSSATVMEARKKGSGSSAELINVVKREDIRAEIENPDDLITSSIHKKLDGSYTFSPSESHVYYFCAENIKNNNKSYNALITIDGLTDDTSTINSQYNMDKIASMEAMDTNYDAISTNKDTAATVIEAIDQWGYHNIKQQDITRNIYVDIDDTKDGKGTTVRITYEYKFYSGGNSVTFPLDGAANEHEYTSIVYDSSESSSAYLKNIYLFYQPWYTSNSSSGYSGCTDVINVNNNCNSDCTLNIIKQNCVDAAYLYSYENAYSVFVNVREKNNNSSKAHLSIRSNLDTNMADPEAAVQPTQAIYGFNYNVNAKEVRKMMSIGKLNEQVASDRLFNVTVAIYDNKVKFKDMLKEKPLITLTGSMVD